MIVFLLTSARAIKLLKGFAALAFQPKVATDTLRMLMNFWLTKEQWCKPVRASFTHKNGQN